MERGYEEPRVKYLFAFSGADPIYSSPSNLRAFDKKTGEVIVELPLEDVRALGVSMTYELDGKQYIAFASSSTSGVAEVVAMSLP